jgi:hypothetical protein
MPTTLTCARDPMGRDRDRDAQPRDETRPRLANLHETRPRRDVGRSRDRLETIHPRPRPHPCAKVLILTSSRNTLLMFKPGSLAVLMQHYVTSNRIYNCNVKCSYQVVVFVMDC